jgi:hypothetical protein
MPLRTMTLPGVQEAIIKISALAATRWLPNRCTRARQRWALLDPTSCISARALPWGIAKGRRKQAMTVGV